MTHQQSNEGTGCWSYPATTTRIPRSGPITRPTVHVPADSRGPTVAPRTRTPIGEPRPGHRYQRSGADASGVPNSVSPSTCRRPVVPAKLGCTVRSSSEHPRVDVGHHHRHDQDTADNRPHEDSQKRSYSIHNGSCPRRYGPVPFIPRAHTADPAIKLVSHTPCVVRRIG